MNIASTIWSEAEGLRRSVFHRRAVAGARAALAAFPKEKPKDVIQARPEPAAAPEQTIYIKDPILSMPHWRRIALDVCEKRGVRLIDVCSARRSTPLVLARHEIMYRLHMETNMSYPAIGRRLGGRDHTTVMYGVRRYVERMQEQAA